MSQISSASSKGAITGPVLMFVASLALAASNIPQSLLPTPVQYGGFGMASTGMAFWQYLIATLFALTVAEPMMVGLIGGGTAHVRTADGTHRVVDGMSTVPLLTHRVVDGMST
eukprot:gene35823-48166_t